MEDKMKLINFVSRKYTYNLLKCLKGGAKRFKDIKEACKGEKMRTQRLKELEERGLINVSTKRAGRRPVSIYNLSEEGRTILKSVDELLIRMKHQQ